MKRSLLSLICVVALSTAAGVHAKSSVNKSVSVPDNGSESSLSSVNGSVTVGRSATVGDVESVNGSIRIESGAFVDSIESVNGSVRIDESVQIEGSIDTVNGAVSIDPNTRILGKVSTVNGGVKARNALIENDIETYNGTVELLDGTIVTGDLYVRKSNSSGWFNKKNKPTRIIIGPGSEIQGDLYFERPVRLSVDKSARIGEVHGDDVEYDMK